MKTRKTEPDIGIAELIDRALQKGIILNADLVVTVAGVPLLAANLRLALASAETMLKYGVMQDLLVNKRAEKENNNQITKLVKLPYIFSPSSPK